MIARFARARRELAARVLGERPVPVGGVARERRLLRRALRQVEAGRVLVVGPGLSTRQVLASKAVDVAGTSPHQSDLTVCSQVRGAGSLPPRRWDTVVITDPQPDLDARIPALRPACRPGARVLVLDRWGHLPREVGAVLADDLVVESVTTRGGSRLLVAGWAS